MKISTFNVNSIKARLDLVLSWLEQRNHDVDILCLQELKSSDEFFPFEEFEKLGYSCAVFGQKTYNGVAICSKFPIKKAEKGFADKSWDVQKRIISVQIQGLTVINIYAPHGGERGSEKFTYKQDWYKKLIAFLDQKYSNQEPLVIVGDFNVTRTNQDVYSPEELEDAVGTMPEERKAFEKLLAWGLIDGFRYVYPENKQFTWWGYMGGAIWKDEGMRIDYILLTKPTINVLKNVEVDLWPRKRKKPTPSDHAPVIVSLDPI
jgi:exodeoxyribonuclease-3